jgi:predicted Rossmann fold nucleotide-binding protein DprA/Smf involved in DNA uptake
VSNRRRKGALPRDPDPRLVVGGRSHASHLLTLIEAEPVHRELVAQALGLDPIELAVLLGELELEGHVRSLPGGLVARARW